MTRLITAGIIVLALFLGWATYKFYQQTAQTQESPQKQPAVKITSADQLSGLPYQLRDSLDAAEKQGPQALANWLKTYGYALQDPAKAWIELDYCVEVSRNDPHQAERVFDAVKKRLSPSSPVWPRIQELSKTYD